MQINHTKGNSGEVTMYRIISAVEKRIELERNMRDGTATWQDLMLPTLDFGNYLKSCLEDNLAT